MQLIKEKWQKEEKEEFLLYLKTLGNPNKEEWTRKIVNTKMTVLAIPTPILKDIAKQILQGNYQSFLELDLNDYYESQTVKGQVLNLIKEYSIHQKYLEKYISEIENWAHCDLLSFNIKDYQKEYFALSNKYIKSNEPFIRRVGLLILMKYLNDEYIDEVIKTIESFKDEEHYYVNMMNAWLLCEAMIKHREKVLAYLPNNNLNKFTINKAISKCRDSYRVSNEDKELLLMYKKK